MKVLIVHAHPEPQSFNAALTGAAAAALHEAGHEVETAGKPMTSFSPDPESLIACTGAAAWARA